MTSSEKRLAKLEAEVKLIVAEIKARSVWAEAVELRLALFREEIERLKVGEDDKRDSET